MFDFTSKIKVKSIASVLVSYHRSNKLLNNTNSLSYSPEGQKGLTVYKIKGAAGRHFFSSLSSF